MKLILVVLLLVSQPLLAGSWKEKECVLQSPVNEIQKMAIVEYVRTKVVKSVLLTPGEQASYDENLYVSDCVKINNLWACFNPYHEVHLLVDFDGKNLKVLNEKQEVVSSYRCESSTADEKK